MLKLVQDGSELKFSYDTECVYIQSEFHPEKRFGGRSGCDNFPQCNPSLDNGLMCFRMSLRYCKVILNN